MVPGRVTLSGIITQVRQRSDLENNEFVSDSELTSQITASAAELYDLLVAAYGEEYSLSTATITTTTEQAYALPSDCYKVDSFEVYDSTGLKRPLKRLPWAERDDNQRRATVRAYAIRGDQVWFFPPPNAGQVVTLWYVPRPSALAAIGTVQVLPQIAQGDTLKVNGVQFSAQSWSSFGTRLVVIFASASTATIPVGYSFTDYAGTKWITDDLYYPWDTMSANGWQTNHYYGSSSIVALTGGGILQCEIAGTSSGTEPTIGALGNTIVDGSITWRIVGVGAGVTKYAQAIVFAANKDLCARGRISSSNPALLPSGVTSIYNAVAATEYTAPTVAGNVFGLWARHPEFTASYLAELITPLGVSPSSALYGIAASAISATITLSGARPYRCSLTDLSATLYAPLERWANYLEGISGWEEYVITDCVIKAKLKDEQDVTPEMAQKEALRQRIIRMSKHRDRGPQRPSDTWGMRGQRPWPWTGGGLR